jgi:hypothetical protein
MSHHDILDRLSQVETVHVLSVFVFVSLAFSGFTAVKMIQLEEQVRAPGTTETAAEEEFSLPEGTPESYGETLDVSYSDVSSEDPKEAQQTIAKMASLEKINLTEAEMERYVEILHDMNGGISCEYCCEVQSIITEEGESACGCSHAAAMRGLTKFLISEHGKEMNDQEIFQEVSKWKTRYFPDQTEAKAEGLQQQDAEVSYVNLASNQYRGVSSKEGGWVGDC